MENNKQETLEEATERYAEIYRCPASNKDEYCKHDIISAVNFGAKWQADRMYSEEDMKQFAFECVGKFLSNDDNKVEIKLVDVIMDRLNKHFEQFKK